MTQLGPSIIRTLVPWVVGLLLGTQVAKQLGLTEGVANEIVTVAVTSAYYALVRVLETRVRPWFGVLLGWAKAPTYDTTKAPQISRERLEQAIPGTTVPRVSTEPPSDVLEGGNGDEDYIGEHRE